ncbi:type IV pilus modification PilV family protein [Vibrio sonorensis]|uniref:type IV pilus modification PilV family protein n=1 Tax=Vibrio sonorensis TaxID=1004316 RepID=UPI0008D9B200|nr:prepilin-type N-terminal cleavage/methylation domain-containing protein [Vibrio sonorensis]
MRSKGFSLLEVALSIAVLGVALQSHFAFSLWLAQQERKVEHERIALLLADNQIKLMLSGGEGSVLHHTQFENLSLCCLMTVKWQRAEQSSSIPNLIRLSLSVEASSDQIHLPIALEVSTVDWASMSSVAFRY